MDLLTNDQDLIDMDYWLHYFHLDDRLPFGDDTFFEWLDKQGKNNISALEFPYFDPIVEDLSLWDCFNSSSLPLLCLKDDNTTQSHGSSGEAYKLEEIRKHFEMPIAMAAKELNVGPTILKKRCRELNIKRWPYRKLMSLKCLIRNVKELGLKEEVEMLEWQKRMMEKQPEMELNLRTKKLRQACFKATYKNKKSRFDSPN
ncbi:protein RKD4 [Artemisia annua]|uniref:Protein RKD4 n=1 Tax=Artemisia annua TaxID=35608 RepID=A0A2U1K8W7_ARTAN|nr:protein RKD4 [Artemisia annua]